VIWMEIDSFGIFPGIACARAIRDHKWGVSAGRLELMLPCLRSNIISDKLLRLLPGLCDSYMCGGSRAIGKAIDEAYSQSSWHSA
jgi:hypothetical protein